MDPQRLLVSDLDGTLLGDVGAAARFSDWFTARRDRWRLAYATGRTLASVMDLVRTGALIAPDAIVSNVGTEIHDPAGDRWPDWPSADPAWDVDRVARTMATLPGISPQPSDAQTAVKASYHAIDLSDASLADIRSRLADDGLDATLVYSAGRYLDVLPAWGGKARATGFLAAAWGFELDQVVVSGDSGNDLDMLESGVLAIVVGNAGPELDHLAGERIYRARAAYADGVLEGLRHWEATAPAAVGVA